jgi:hypothetical protein
MNILSWLSKATHSPCRRAKRPWQARLKLERLEDRLAPASATFSGGVFTLTGLAASANNITVSTPVNNSVKIVLGNGDTFTSSPAGADFVLSQTVNANDTLTANTAAAGHSPFATFQLNLGSAVDTLNFALSAASTGVGNVAINLGTNVDQVNFGSININGNLSIFGGDGSNNPLTGVVTFIAGAQVTTHGGVIGLFPSYGAIDINAGASLQSAGGKIMVEGDTLSSTTIGAINAGSGTVFLTNHTNFSTSSRTQYTYLRVDLPVVHVYSTEVIVSLPGKPNVDLTFAKPFSDPAVQTAIQQIKQQLAKGGTVHLVGPTLTSNSVTSTTVFAGNQVAATKVSAATTTYDGPVFAHIGNLQSETIFLLTGRIDIDTLITAKVVDDSQYQKTVTTGQVYRIGTPSRWR